MQIAELQQRLTALQVDQVALQEGRRTAEAESTETKVALQAAEGRASRAEVHATEGVKQASVELLERMLKAVCSRAVIDNNTIGALLQEQEFVQCRSCAGRLLICFWPDVINRLFIIFVSVTAVSQL